MVSVSYTHLDAAHGVGSRRDGSFGMEYIDVAILSFHPVKHIACGEGGMVLTNDIDVYEKLKLFRTHGIVKNISMKDTYEGDWAYDMVDLGYNYRMSDILAALGISQAKRLEENIKDRNSIADRYLSLIHIYVYSRRGVACMRNITKQVCCNRECFCGLVFKRVNKYNNIYIFIESIKSEGNG